MKTPDDIKKGLECCDEQMNCDGCPYHGEADCSYLILKDGLSYIKSLELDIAERDELCESFRDKAMQLDAQVPRWISVGSEEKLMHCKEYLCLCTLPNDPMHEWDYIAVLRWNGYGGNGYVNGPHFQHEGLEGMKVTHWMPLPEPPKEEK